MEHENRRFCGRCQTWLRDAIEVHHCVKSPLQIGYAWFEPDEPAFEKNDILHEGRKHKRGELIREFHASPLAVEAQRSREAAAKEEVVDGRSSSQSSRLHEAPD